MATYEGGCECGTVRYRLTSEPIFVNACHCRQCQKITGSAFAINAMIEADRIELLEGGDSLVDALGATRCRRCGALLWAAHPKFGDAIQFVRVGTLDQGERMSPDAHFFVRSKYPWVTIPSDLPTFETLPTEQDPPLVSEAGAARLEAARAG